MGALDLPLDIITVLIACVALGISDDDTVHFFLHFRHARADGLAPDEAARRTAAELARPAAAMSVALAAGFLVFCASTTTHLARFGLLTATAIVLAFACEIVLTPALLVAFLFRTLDAFRVFDVVYVMTGGGPGTATEPIALYTFTTLMQNLRFGYGSALSVIVFLVAFGFALVVIRVFGGDAFLEGRR